MKYMPIIFENRLSFNMQLEILVIQDPSDGSTMIRGQIVDTYHNDVLIGPKEHYKFNKLLEDLDCEMGEHVSSEGYMYAPRGKRTKTKENSRS